MSRPLVGDLRAVELVTQEEAFLGSHVRALLVSLAEKDASTEEHTRRVALRSVEVGEELGLPASRLRGLALGGLLHDMGKLAVPGEVLRKPGSLDDDEFDLVKRHPQAGVRLLRDLGGFSDVALELVRHHHERLDGSGYPDGIGGENLDLDTRILAVCDVYDALVSPRVYREAWSHERAIALLRDAGAVRPALRRGARACDRSRAGLRPRRRSLTPGAGRIVRPYAVTGLPNFCSRYRRYGSGSIGPPATRSIVSAGVEPAPEGVEMLAQPLVDGCEVAALDHLVGVADVLAQPLPDLHRDHVPELVGREVAEAAERPVHVLEARRAGHRARSSPRYSWKRVFQASGRSAVESRPERSSCSSSKRRMMWSP